LIIHQSLFVANFCVIFLFSCTLYTCFPCYVACSLYGKQELLFNVVSVVLRQDLQRKHRDRLQSSASLQLEQAKCQQEMQVKHASCIFMLCAYCRTLVPGYVLFVQSSQLTEPSRHLLRLPCVVMLWKTTAAQT